MIVAAVVACYLLVFCNYGFQVEDEGLLLFQIARVHVGDVAYIDFHTGYTPLFYALHEFWVQIFGLTTGSIRGLQTLVLSASGAAMYALARPMVGAWLAALPVVAWVVFLPVFQGEFASFNVPYPVWAATAAYLGCMVALVSYARSPRIVKIAVAGLLAAVGFGIKLNAGAFALAASAWIAVTASKTETLLDRFVAGAAAAFMFLSVWAVFAFVWRDANALVHILPCFFIACASVLMRGRYACADSPRVTVALGALAGGFLLPTAAWSVSLFAELGAARFAREVLLIGADYSGLYFVPYPDPGVAGCALAAGFVAVALVGRGARRMGFRVSVPRVVGAAALFLAVAAPLARTAAMPEGVVRALAGALEESSAVLIPLVHLTGLAVLARAYRRGGSAMLESHLTVLVVAAVTMFLQAFPRTDSMHLIIAAPASLVLGACLLDRALRPWRELRAVGSVTAAGLVAGCVLVAAVAVVAAKAGPTFAQAIALDAVQVATPTVRVGVEDRGADDLGAFGLTAAYVRENTESGQKVLAFPALTGVLFAAERQSPVYHDYWYPGRPNREEETDMVDALRADPPALVVSLNQGWTFFSRSPLYFASVREFVVDNYRLTARFGRYDVLAPRELAATIKRSVWQPRSGGPGRGARDAGQAGADIYAVVPAYRRQAARRWLAGMRAETCRSAVLDAAPRLATLRLRAIHDGGDARAVGWLLQGYRRTEARVREQSLRAMSQATERLEAARFRWANDFDPRPYALCAEPWLGELRSLAFDGGADVDPRAQSFALALVRTLFAETAPGKP